MSIPVPSRLHGRNPWLVPALLAMALLATASGSAAPARTPPHPPTSPPANAVEIVSGLHYVVLKPAKAPAATVSADFVEYRLSAWSADGVLRIDGAREGVQTRPLKQLVRGWPGFARALLVTPIGETRRWWISAERMLPAYKDAPAQAHVLELTVIGNADPVPTPKDVGAPPPDVQVTASGLAYKVIKRGKPGAHPVLASTVELDYSGWTRDGQLFDSSVLRGERARFPLQGLIAGWQEGLQLMSIGDTFRFWIPGHLAYDGVEQPGTPKGMLVFDVTLYGFETPTP